VVAYIFNVLKCIKLLGTKAYTKEGQIMEEISPPPPPSKKWWWGKKCKAKVEFFKKRAKHYNFGHNTPPPEK